MQGDLWAEAGIREGDVLAKKYRVERVLGVGGMGVVVAAVNIELDSKVAIKFLRLALLDEPHAIERFVGEARKAVKINSEHVARVLDVGTLENGAPFIVMELLEGGDLSAWVKQRGALPIDLAVDFVLQACVGVAEAHALTMVHRDLKPSNLFCVRRSDGQLIIKVLDFGISKAKDARSAGSGMSVTKTGSVMGSPLYMSPEQMLSAKDVDPQADVWALGVILFELLTGRTPFYAETLPELAVLVATEPPPPLRSLRPEAPAGLEAALLRCLQRRRQDRYRNVGELARALVDFGPPSARTSVERIAGILQTAGQSASDLFASAASPPERRTVLAPETLPPVGRTAPDTAHGKKAVAGGAALIALFLLAGGAVVVRRSATQQSEGQAHLPDAGPTLAQSPALSSDVPTARPTDVPSASLAPEVDVPVEVPEAKEAGHGETLSGPPQLPTSAPPKTPPATPPPKAERIHIGAGATPASVAGLAAKPGCDPNFFLDDQGRKHFKPECFLTPKR